MAQRQEEGARCRVKDTFADIYKDCKLLKKMVYMPPRHKPLLSMTTATVKRL